MSFTIVTDLHYKNQIQITFVQKANPRLQRESPVNDPANHPSHTLTVASRSLYYCALDKVPLEW